ncbi:MAG: ATP-binding protein [Anaerolineae bacterium]
MPLLKAHLLGQLELLDSEDRVLSLPTTLKARSLLAYLLLHRSRPQPRERLSALFWGERPEQKARHSLSTALWRLRRSLPDEEVILSDHHTVQLDPQADLWLDVDAFEELVEREDASDLQAAVALYRGPFLDGFYDDWVINERYRLEALYLDALARLMSAYEDQGQHASALTTALRLLKEDPLREDAHRAAMRAYCRLGRRNAALEQYRRCRERVQAELDAEPMPETATLHQEILEGRFAVGPTLSAPAFDELPPTSPAISKPYDPLDVGATSPLVGRDEELARLQACWREAERGRGRVVFLRGEAGVGKTRLVEELARRVRQRGAWVAGAACYEHERTLPVSPLAELLRAVLDLVGEGVLQRLSSWQLADLARLAPELEAHLPSRFQGSPLAEGGQPRLLHVFTSLLLELAEQNPLLLTLEDLHWAHDSTLAWLHYLARHLGKSPLLLVVTYRPEELAPDGAVNSLIRRLQHEGLGQALTLSRLSRADLARWMRGLDASVVADVHRHTEGNPFFVLETQRALLEAEYLRLDEGRWVTAAPLDEIPVPDSIRRAVAMRLNRLGPEAARAIEIAAVAGRTFDFDVLQRSQGRDEEATLEALDELLRRRLVREGSGFFGRDYAFDHHLVREIVRERLDDRRRRWLHRRVAEALVELRADDPSASAEVAYHYVRAEDWARAQEYLFRAGEQAARVAADAEALDYYRRAVEAYESAFGDDRVPLRQAILEHRMGECFFRRGEYTQALECLQQALTLLGRPFPTSRRDIRWAIVGALGRQIVRRLALRRLLRRGAVDDPAAIKEEVDIYTFIGWIYALLPDHEAFLLMALRALHAADQINFLRGDALAAGALAFALDFISLFPLAGYFHRRAAAQILRIADAGTIGFVFQGLAYHHYLLGEEQDALTYAHRSAEAYRNAGDAHRWALATLLIFYVHEHRGELADALEYAQQIVRTGHEVADQWALCAGEEALGIIRRHQGRLDEAIAHLQRAAALAEEIPDYMSLVEARGELGKCYLRQGQWRQAVDMLEKTQEIATRHNVAGDSLGRFLNGLAEAYLLAAERSDESDGVAWLERARVACRATLKQSKGYHPGQPTAMRLRGACAWLKGNPVVARRWWRRSLELAEAMAHDYDAALTTLEMGARLGDEDLLRRAEGRLAEIGAGWHLARARKLLNETQHSG